MHTCFFIACLLAANASFAQSTAIVGGKLPGHPRLLLYAGEEKAIKANIAADASWRSIHQSIIAQCDSFENRPVLQHIKIGRRLLDKSRECLRRVFYLSYAWRMTKQEKYLVRAEKELLAVSAFSDWNPTHFLDVAEMTLAVSIGYDWLYHDLSEPSRAVIRQAILEKGLQPSLESKFNGWLKATHNWNQVCNGGITYGALAVYESDTVLCRQLISRALTSIRLPMSDYEPDGAYPEGYNYWGYGTGYNVMFLSAMEKIFGDKVLSFPVNGFLKTAGFMQHMTGAAYGSFNFSDAGTGEELQPAMFWFAEKRKDPSLLWVERSHLAETEKKKYLTNTLLPAIMIWGKTVSLNKLPAPRINTWVGAGKNPVALMRTAWSDTAIYLGLKAGSPSVNHGHMDVGSFVMDAAGVRWAMDFGMQSYESLESKGVDLWNMKQQSQRWSIFRYNNFAHNTLSVNNEWQKVDGKAVIRRTSNDPGFLSAVTDITGLYEGALKKAVRGVAIVDQAYVWVRDEVVAENKEAVIRWTMATTADAKIVDAHTIELTKKGKKLWLVVQEPALVTMKTWSTNPVQPFDAPNPGSVLVGFETTLAAGSGTAIHVLLIPGGSAGLIKKEILSLESWPVK